MHGLKRTAKIVSLFVVMVLVLTSISVPIAQAQGNDPTDGWTKHYIDASLGAAAFAYVHDMVTPMWLPLGRISITWCGMKPPTTLLAPGQSAL
jgi:hypothetical protein